ncbi:TVP38/TMEM64 family protein [Halomonas sp. TRM85114]|uniref:TVP38/TMEM64 family protein n=1 Tax=Halomonas jincaotanensis TaxID=2810616 RepID=UPI001BD3169A|nr:TVP38/TMEM64 family protein [Halomonas jincaotanensis]MBS9402697.1 TVP38/TMEM64 family protein [Halomonas jincaotanensis]
MRRPWVIPALMLGALVIMGGLWQWLAMQDLLTVANLKRLAAGTLAWRDSPLAFVVVMGIYATALLVMFPLSLMVAATGLIFGPTWGFVYATLGTLASSVVSYWVGRRLGRETLMAYGGHHLEGMSRYLAKRGIRTMTLINLLPLAPFTLTNMMAGAFHLRFRDYMLGSLLGILPGLGAVTLLGSQLGELITAENRQELLWSLGGLALGIALLVGLRHLSSRTRTSSTQRQASRLRARSGRSSDAAHQAATVSSHRTSSDNPSMSQSQSSDDSSRD